MPKSYLNVFKNNKTKIKKKKKEKRKKVRNKHENFFMTDL